MELEARVVLLEQKIDDLESQVNSLDTQLNAAEQALAAIRLSKRNKEKIDNLQNDLDSRFELFSQALHGAEKLIHMLVSAGLGAVLFWLGNPFLNDSYEGNDEVAYILFMVGMGFLGYGLLVLTENDRLVLGLIEKINPFKK